MFFIAVVTKKSNRLDSFEMAEKYLSKDDGSWFWCRSWRGAQYFSTIEEAQKILKNIVNGKNRKMKDGTTRPNVRKEEAFDMHLKSNKKLKASGTIQICKLEHSIVHQEKLEAEIKKTEK